LHKIKAHWPIRQYSIPVLDLAAKTVLPKTPQP